MNIKQFYNNKAVLLTGTTGFIGKVMLYRLLQQFPNLHKIFLLVREKKGIPLSDRV